MEKPINSYTEAQIKQAIENGVEYARFKKKIARMLDIEFNSHCRATQWEFLELEDLTP